MSRIKLLLTVVLTPLFAAGSFLVGTPTTAQAVLVVPTCPINVTITPQGPGNIPQKPEDPTSTAYASYYLSFSGYCLTESDNPSGVGDIPPTTDNIFSDGSGGVLNAQISCASISGSGWGGLEWDSSPPLTSNIAIVSASGSTAENNWLVWDYYTGQNPQTLHLTDPATEIAACVQGSGIRSLHLQGVLQSYSF